MRWLILVMLLGSCAMPTLWATDTPADRAARSQKIAQECLRQVAGDQLDTFLAWSTESCRTGSVNAYESRIYLRLIQLKDDGTTGAVLVAVTVSRGWLEATEFRFLVTDKLQVLPATRVASDVKCNAAACTHWEMFTALIPLEQVRSWSSPPTVRIVGRWNQDLNITHETIQAIQRWLTQHPPPADAKPPALPAAAAGKLI